MSAQRLIGMLATGGAILVGPLASEGQESRVEVRIDATQARSTLDLFDARMRGEPVLEAHWSEIFESDGFRRVVERERGMEARFGLERTFTEEAFRAWATSDEALVDVTGRSGTLDAWKSIDVTAAGERAMRYLPASVKLEATIYPIVREQTNSFVWDLPENPAIFMWVGPDVDREELEMTLVHELHHVGLAGVCVESETSFSAEVEQARGWLSGFAEGLAVLAAAGGPDHPTHPASQTELREAWASRQDSLETDLRRVETFLLDIAQGRLSGDEASGVGMSFISAEGVPQGAFYSLGWFMGATVERTLGRDAVIAGTCDHGRLIVDYQRAAALANRDDPQRALPVWSDALLDALGLR